MPYKLSQSSNPLDLGSLQHSSNLGFGDNLSTNPSGLEFNDNLGPVTMDHNLDFDNNRFANKPFSLRNKFLNYNKYLDASNNLNSDPPFHNSQFSDKPFDWDDFNSAAAIVNDGVINDKDFHIKGSSSFAEAQNEIGSTANATTETNKIVKAPSTISLSDTNTEVSQTDTDYGSEIDAT